MPWKYIETLCQILNAYMQWSGWCHHSCISEQFKCYVYSGKLIDVAQEGHSQKDRNWAAGLQLCHSALRQGINWTQGDSSWVYQRPEMISSTKASPGLFCTIMGMCLWWEMYWLWKWWWGTFHQHMVLMVRVCKGAIASKMLSSSMSCNSTWSSRTSSGLTVVRRDGEEASWRAGMLMLLIRQ